ncbi:Protein CBG22773 [Caenorhabditis briggsae]|uniref:Protein CBG22773 n=1 Tax=Caenorhabditis briggsae TaxID=6238 RepID=A8Y2V3_CAEBR|nr:Protein CBG22773 [Caenorhabditis briggsae]CAP39287.2 Protein CBG22773 [Caenorhabditis briggsae]
MKYVYLSLLIIFLGVCLAFTTDSQYYEVDDHHDESIHDVQEDENSDVENKYIEAMTQKLSSMSKSRDTQVVTNCVDNILATDDVKNHIKDIVRGFSDKGFEDCDTIQDGFLDATEVECFISEKMGFDMKKPGEQIVAHYDKDMNDKLDKDEVWNIVENKNDDLYEVKPSTVEMNMKLLQGLQGADDEAPALPGQGIFF